MKAAITLAARSEIGILNQMPSTPQKSGRMSKSGMSITTWRLSERMMAFFAMPMLWKKFDVTIWKPMIGKNIITIRRPRADGDFHHLVYALVLACAVVISRNGLHALVQPHYNHHEEEADAVHNAERSDGKVSVV